MIRDPELRARLAASVPVPQRALSSVESAANDQAALASRVSALEEAVAQFDARLVALDERCTRGETISDM